MGMEYYDPDSGGLTSLLEIMLSEYEQDYEGYWGLDRDEPPPDLNADDWRLAKSLDQVGRAALESVHALSVAPAMHPFLESIHPVGKRTEALREAAQYNITLHGLEIELARLALDRVPKAAQRVREMVLLVSEVQLSPRAAAYVDRATRLYLWGFDPECIVMCRSILEAALQARITDSQMLSLGFERRKSSFTLLDYIRAAEQTQMLTADERDWAHEVRLAGNDAVHVTPGIQPSAFDALLNIAVLMRRLFPG